MLKIIKIHISFLMQDPSGLYIVSSFELVTQLTHLLLAVFSFLLLLKLLSFHFTIVIFLV